ncbi:MAG: hypothetical protein EHM17_17265 [Verrucomicrobiaceae bacterium]|nr:MAG: hypothetical protein EHM17_17265 [Verrucomicrobiaceae bacterium]
MQLTALQLKEKDPKRFEKEYYDWCNHYPDHDWWDFIEEDLTEQVSPMGVRVDSIYFESHYRTAGFNGHLTIAPWMQSQKLDEKWYPLWVAFEQDGGYVRVSNNNRRSGFSLDWNDDITCTVPEGVFSDMAQQDWEDMLQDQLMQSSIYSLIEDWINEQGHDLGTRLREAYEWETSEENFLDMCEANEVTFTYEGDDDEVPA